MLLLGRSLYVKRKAILESLSNLGTRLSPVLRNVMQTLQTPHPKPNVL
jgi:hypothetical protein